MKALSLWQPWASAVALGSKRIETRAWSTNYRGPLAIHAAKRCVMDELDSYQRDPSWAAALGIVPARPSGAEESLKVLPFGCVVAVCDLVDCVLTESLPTLFDEGIDIDIDYGGWTERQMGDFTPGRFAWILVNVRKLALPLPLRGAQGLFTIPDINI